MSKVRIPPIKTRIGYATALHEIGHILLHSSAHAHSGIMRRRFQKAERRLAATGQLRFTPAAGESGSPFSRSSRPAKLTSTA